MFAFSGQARRAAQYNNLSKEFFDKLKELPGLPGNIFSCGFCLRVIK